MSIGTDESDQTFSTIVTELNKLHDIDMKTADFFSLLRGQNSNSDSLYEEPQKSSDVAIFSQPKPYPKEILDAVHQANRRVYFGAFPQMGRFYCIVDNSIYFWQMSGDDQVTKIEAKGTIVTAIACGEADRHCIEKESKKNAPSHVVIYATNKEITVLPVNWNTIYSDYQFSKSISHCITSIVISEKGDVFYSDETGDIFYLQYFLSSTNQSVKEFKIKNRTHPIISFIPQITRLAHPIIQLVLCDSADFLAALTSNSYIYFYRIIDNKLEKVSYYKPEPRQKIVSVSSIPVSDSSVARFIAFTEDSQRLIFGTLYNPNPDTDILGLPILRIDPQQVRPPPSILLSSKLVYGHYSLGFTFFLYRDRIAVSTPDLKPHSVNLDPIERICIYSISQSSLSFFCDEHILSDRPISLFTHPIITQHLITPKPGYLMTTAGSIVVTFSHPVDILRRLLEEYKGSFAEPIRDWMLDYKEHSESLSTCLLLASRSPDLRRWSLFIIQQFVFLNSQVHEGNAPSPGVIAFFMRLVRLLSPIWSSPLFTPQLILSPVFKELPDNLPEILSDLCALCDEYVKIKRNSSSQSQSSTIAEASWLSQLAHFIRLLIEILRFSKIILTSKKSLVKSAMTITSDQSKYRLIEQPFITGDRDDVVTIIEALRDLASCLFKTKDGPNLSDNRARLLSIECPTLFSEADARLMEALDTLRSALSMPVEKRQTIVKHARDVFVTNASQPLQLLDICTLFAELQYYKGAIDVCLSRASAIDPMQRALSWYKGGRNVEEIKHRELFDRRYNCYSLLFPLVTIVEAFDLMMKSEDELFHSCLYNHLLKSQRLDLLLSVKTQFIKQYLENNAPQHLWQYFQNQKDYATAAAHLYTLATSGKVALDQRVKWLARVVQFLSGAGMTTDCEKARHTLLMAQVQRDYAGRLAADSDELMDDQELFDKCAESNFWDLTIRILSDTPVTGYKKQLISKCWASLITMLLNEPDLVVAQNKIAAAAEGIAPENEALDSSIMVPLVEDFRMNKEAPVTWGMETILRCGVKPTNLLTTYLEAAGNNQTIDAVRAGLVVCVGRLAEKDGVLVAHHQKEMKAIEKWMTEKINEFPIMRQVEKVFVSYKK